MTDLPTSAEVEDAMDKVVQGSTILRFSRANNVRLAQHLATSATYAPLVEAVKEWQEARKAEREMPTKEYYSGGGYAFTAKGEEAHRRTMDAEKALAALPLPEVPQ